MACGNSNVKANEKSLGKGKTMKLTFITNPSTGFDWEYKFLEGDNYAKIVLDREDYDIKSGDIELVGAPTKRTYFFRAEKPGKQSLTFTYRRPWEGGEVSYDVVYELSVDKDLNISCLSKMKGVVETKKELSTFPDPEFE